MRHGLLKRNLFWACSHQALRGPAQRGVEVVDMSVKLESRVAIQYSRESPEQTEAEDRMKQVGSTRGYGCEIEIHDDGAKCSGARCMHVPRNALMHSSLRGAQASCGSY